MTTYYTPTVNDPYNVSPQTVEYTYWQLPADFWGRGTYDAYNFDEPIGNDRNYWVTPDEGVDMPDKIRTSDAHVDTAYGGQGDDTIWTRGHNDVALGGGGDDTIYGGDEDDTVYGDWANVPDLTDSTTWYTPTEDSDITGDDLLFGGNGSDTLIGGAGNDQLDGGPRGSNWTDVVTGGDGADAFLLSYPSDSGNDTDIWSTYAEDFTGLGAYDLVNNTIEGLSKEALTELFGSIGTTILLSGVGSALGTAASDLVDMLFDMNKTPPPKTREDVLVITDFNPSEDTLFLPLTAGTTLNETVSYFTSAAVSGVSGWGIQFQSGVNGTTYAEVFLDPDYLAALGIASESSTYTIGAIEAVLATQATITSSGIDNSGQVYAFGDDDTVDMQAPSGTDIQVFGAFGPLSIVNPESNGRYVVGGTIMGDIITVNETLFTPDSFVASSDQNASDDAYVRGFDGDDLLYGGEGADHLIGDGGDDQLYGYTTRYTTGVSPTPVDETLDGGDGDDFLSIGTGGGTLLGGDGNDTASFAYGTVGGVRVDLAVGTGYDAAGTASAPNYALSGIEALVGTAYADTLIGSDGDDVLDGGAGGDSIDGGSGQDTVTYADSTSAVAVSFVTGEGSAGDADGDHLGNIEVAIGSAYADVLTGDGAGRTLIGGAGNDTFIGSNGTDVVSYATATSGVYAGPAAGSGAGDGAGDVFTSIDVLEGSGYDDTLASAGEDATLYGFAGDDKLYGGNGDDTLEGGAGNDAIDGNDGNNTVSYSASGSGVTVSLATGSASGGDAAGDYLVHLGNTIGSAYGDTLSGNDDDNALYGAGGDDTLDGDAGGDSLYGGSGNDTVTYASSTAGVAVDLVTGEGSGGDADGDRLNGVEVVIGSAHADTLTGNGSGETLIGGAGADTFIGGSGVDVVSYATATSGVYAGPAAGSGAGDGTGDVFAGIDVLEGSGYDDTLASAGEDATLYGFAGDDKLYGGNGDDTLEGGAGNDAIDGNDGNNTVSYAASGSGVTVSLATGSASGGDAAGDYLVHLSNIIGSAYGDTLTGNDDDNAIDGGDGGDLLYGGNGDDTLTGGSGNGTDTFVGGNGVDVIVVALDETSTTFSADSGSANYWNGSGAGGSFTFDWTSVEYIQFADGLYSLAGTTSSTLELTEVTDSVTVTELSEDDSVEGAGAGARAAAASGHGGFVHKALGLVELAGIDADRDATITLQPSGEDYVGTVTASIVDGRLRWAYEVADAEIEDLDGGETVVQRYVASVDDGRGGVGHETLWVTLVGADDFPSRTLYGDRGDDFLRGGRGDDRLYGRGGDDALKGGKGADVAFGGRGRDRIAGEDGVDRLEGGAGDDVLSGGRGDDLLIGGAGHDFLRGGAGNDVFRFAAGDGRDRVSGFQSGRDIIDLSTYDEDGDGHGDLAFADLSFRTGWLGTTVSVGNLQIHLSGVAEVTERDFYF